MLEPRCCMRSCYFVEGTIEKYVWICLISQFNHIAKILAVSTNILLHKREALLGRVEVWRIWRKENQLDTSADDVSTRKGTITLA